MKSVGAERKLTSQKQLTVIIQSPSKNKRKKFKRISKLKLKSNLLVKIVKLMQFEKNFVKIVQQEKYKQLGGYLLFVKIKFQKLWGRNQNIPNSMFWKKVWPEINQMSIKMTGNRIFPMVNRKLDRKLRNRMVLIELSTKKQLLSVRQKLLYLDILIFQAWDSRTARSGDFGTLSGYASGHASVHPHLKIKENIGIISEFFSMLSCSLLWCSRIDQKPQLGFWKIQ